MAEKTLIIRKEDAGTALQTDCLKMMTILDGKKQPRQ